MESDKNLWQMEVFFMGKIDMKIIENFKKIVKNSDF
jgi:hypothetical protein